MQNIAWHNADGGQPTFVIANVEQFPGLFGGSSSTRSGTRFNRRPPVRSTSARSTPR
jgi:hypothetical protein